MVAAWSVYAADRRKLKFLVGGAHTLGCGSPNVRGGPMAEKARTTKETDGIAANADGKVVCFFQASG